MIPILFEKTETAFNNNGLGRLRDVIECTVTEGRNEVYECDFSYPLTGANFDLIQVGRIIAVTHDDTGDLEPFDIVSYSRPINGVVEFHCVHISYRLSYCTVTGSGINSLADAFTLFESAEPNMPFTFQTDKASLGYMAAADGTPRTVRELMGGVEGSILDAYGGEYKFNNWNVYLYAARGQQRNVTIRYGVNMLDYNEDFDASGTYSSVIPYWTDGTNIVLGDKIDSASATITGRGETVPLDVSDKFENQPTKEQVEAEAENYFKSHNTTIPSQSIKIEFVRLQDMGYENIGDLLTCELCDTINVIFPDYNTTGKFKIVKTVWDVLADRFESMELGELSTSLSQALGISNGLNNSGGGGSSVISSSVPTADTIAEFDSTAHMNSTDMTSTEVSDFVDGLDAQGANLADYVVEQGTSGIWTYRKWNSGIAECWGRYSKSVAANAIDSSNYVSYPFTFTATPIITLGLVSGGADNYRGHIEKGSTSATQVRLTLINKYTSAVVIDMNIHCLGRWK